MMKNILARMILTDLLMILKTTTTTIILEFGTEANTGMGTDMEMDTDIILPDTSDGIVVILSSM